MRPDLLYRPQTVSPGFSGSVRLNLDLACTYILSVQQPNLGQYHTLLDHPPGSQPDNRLPGHPSDGLSYISDSRRMSAIMPLQPTNLCLVRVS